jgi:Glutamate decarboxylase and related PLP-dependent proteins
MLNEPLPQQSSEPGAVLDAVVHRVFASIGHLNHPRFFGFIPTPGNYMGVIADLLTSGYTPFCGTWLEGSGPAQIELTTVQWLLDLFRFPAGSGGLFLSGGSLANLTALAGARERAGAADRSSHSFYCSDQTHSSIDRALRILGYRADQLRRLESDGDFRLNMDSVARAVSEDRRRGLRPACLIVNVGATNTGAVDPLPAAAEFCAREHLWLHADGAYGAAAILSDRAALLDGIEAVDSLTLDPHKWFFQPYVAGCLLVRDPDALKRCFQILPEYLQDTKTEGREVNFCDFGPELTRPFRALKLWMSLKTFGAEAFARAISHGFQLAEAAERMLRAEACWELAAPAQMGIVCFRYIRPGAADPELDAINLKAAELAAADGCCFLSTTGLRGRTVLRMCTINPETTEEDLRLSIRCLRKYAEG